MATSGLVRTRARKSHRVSTKHSQRLVARPLANRGIHLGAPFHQRLSLTKLSKHGRLSELRPDIESIRGRFVSAS